MRRALEVIADRGPQALSLRSLAADVNVSHTAPRHHFGDLRGVVTAIAVEGFELLSEHLAAVRESGGDFKEVGVGYVEFALSHRAHFAVMFTPGWIHDDDPALQAARDRSFAMLSGGVEALRRTGQVQDPAAAVIAAWGLMHGIATLALAGALDQARLSHLVADGDIAAIARRAAGLLFTAPTEHPAPEQPTGTTATDTATASEAETTEEPRMP